MKSDESALVMNESDNDHRENFNEAEIIPLNKNKFGSFLLESSRMKYKLKI